MTPDESAIDQLAHRAADGDELALARLLAAVRPRVYRWALVHTAAPDDAEDITQQALLRVAAKLSSFAFASRFTTWLYTVTRSTAADWRRTRHRRRDLLALQPPQPHFAAPAPRDDDRLILLVRAQLGSLPARQRELFDLVDLQGHTPAEAAAMIGMNHSTARVHVLRARRAIRARILALHPDIVEELA